MKNILEYFKEAEDKIEKPYSLEDFKCKCGKCNTTLKDNYFVDFMNYLYAETGKKFVVTSAMRCYEHNKKIGGLPNSDHTRGEAIDVATLTIEDRSLLVYHAYRFGIMRAIVYINKKFVHLSINYSDRLTRPLLLTNEEIK